jgi:N-acetylneuraminic acid mutarotase
MTRGLTFCAVLLAVFSNAGFLPAQEPAARFNHTAVWTGTEMIVWGGRATNGVLNTGGRYNPLTRTWTAMPTNGAPSPREYHVAQWTGSEMIVWGGALDPFTLYNNGARYNPSNNTWAAITNIGAPTARAYHSIVWNGAHAILWGGSSNSSGSGEVYYNTGGRYSPASNNWAATATTGAPVMRADHTAVWTGDRMIIWGGLAKDAGAPEPNKTNTGAIYNATNNTWSATTTNGAPRSRASHTAVWTGSRMIVWGGVGTITATDIYNTGGRYDPVANSWAATSTNSGVPSVRQDHTAVWTGTEMIVWGGQGSVGNYRDSGGRYNPTTDTWTTTATGPAGRAYHTAVWTGSEMIVWGGYGFSGALQGLARYRPAENTWNTAPLCSLTAPGNGSSHGAGSTITLTASATDTDGIITQVQFFDGATLLNTDTGAPYTYNWTASNAGPHTLTAVATDNNSLKTTSAPVSITIIGPPVVSLTSPANGSTHPGGGAIALAASAAPASGATLTQVAFYDGATLLNTDSSAPYEYNWSGATAGAHTLTAHATDNYGTISTSAPVAITVNTPPSTGITSPSSGTVIVEHTPVTIAATASDPDGTVTQVAFYDGPTLLGVTNSAPYQFNWDNVPPGIRMLTTRATDNLGVVSTSAVVALTANILPNVAAAAPLNGSQVAANEPIPLNASATDTDGSIAQVQFLINGSPLGADTTAPFQLNWTNAPLGFHTLTMVATDNLGMSRTSAPVSLEAVLRPQVTSSWASNRIWVHVTGAETGRTYVVQMSSNLVNWVPFKTNVAVDGTFSINDPAGSALQPQRFYRADP